jgi:3-hydroxybutyryl-CoA dehydrogenase
MGAGDFEEKGTLLGSVIIRVHKAENFSDYPDADLYIDGDFNGYFADISGPLIFHCPAITFDKIPNAPEMSARFCAWPGFWDRKHWEISLQSTHKDVFTELLSKLSIQAKIVQDIPGLIAPRILCTIINEAVYTLADNIANEYDIDIAMKLGTNYPYGPMEWARHIGLNNIKQVLTEMGMTDARYLPSKHFDKI